MLNEIRKIYDVKIANDFLTISKNSSITLFFILILETILGNSGRWLVIGPLSIRMILFIFVLVSSTPLMLHFRKHIFKNTAFRLNLLFVVVLLVYYSIGVVNGYKISNITRDFLGFSMLFLLPSLLAFSFLNEKESIKNLVEILIIGSVVVLSIGVTIIFFALAFISSNQIVLLNSFLLELNFGGIAITHYSIYRVFLRSELYLQIGLVLLTMKAMNRNPVSKWQYFSIGNILFTLNVSFTRSFWIGTLTSFIILLFFYKNSLRQQIKLFTFSIIFFLAFQAFSFFVYDGHFPLEAAFNRVFPYNNSSQNDRDGVKLLNLETRILNLSQITQYNVAMVMSESDSYRMAVFQELVTEIKRNPVFGSGLGKTVKNSQVTNWTEYFYLDLIMKTGFIGLLSFFAPIIFIVYKALLMREQTDVNLSLPFTIALIGIIATSAFNPFMNNPIGLLYLLLTYFVVNTEFLSIDHSSIKSK